MQMRMNHRNVNPELLRTMMGLESFVKGTGLDPVLYELIKIRASQINGCAYCLDMHTRDLRKMGETEQRVFLIPVWREAPCYSPKEKAVLELTEAVTLIADGGVPDDLYSRVREQLSEQEYLAVVMAINTINCWNRIGIANGLFPGCYEKQPE
ncbi:hypothetical protein J31TS4_04720 [Paenibacillus sp. J31TS4]|uniref:carboxymuconolactone decarboxylase family protein n=1 Tax=Paenibacillus sp. J31TS4 TaxID=2807195 RepID=UPI001B21DA21|nr:carboxymuconolactone decarboxylase family protein [Paenibacillus sp. J31TS4]GIP37192.1 hypothetical protein J31TS4_04720 [Paenibacillus sp. J31TS4]